MAGLEGTKLGAYELLERIGGGGMAEVYRAKQATAFGREVAIKVIRAGYSEDQTFRERFLREAQAISKLSHPNILPLIEFGEDGETLFLVMPLAREGTLRDLLKQHSGPLPLEEAIPIFTQLCDAVQYAHEQGIIHRDLKPQNVLLQRKTHVLLADFGIARDSGETGHLTATGAGIGTVEYMAPEQAMGQADARSDIYSLGIVLYQLLTGTVPFSGTTPFQIIMKQTNDPLPDPRSFNSALPAELLQVLKTALAKDPNRRFQSAQALGRAVQQVRPDIGPTAFPSQGQAGGARPPAAGFPGPQIGNPPPLTRSRPTTGTRGTGIDQGGGPPPTRTGATRPPVSTRDDWGESLHDYDDFQGPPPGRGGWADGPVPPAGGYDQPTWGTRSGPRQTLGGRGTAYGRPSGPPPGYVDDPYQTPPRRGNGPLIAAIIAALLAVLIISTVAYGYFAGGWFSTAASPTPVVQGPTATSAPTDTATATLTPSPSPTDTATATPTATPIPAFKVTGINATVSPGSWNTPCGASQTFTFNATINVNAGPNNRSVTYYWTRSDGASSPPVTVNVPASSTSIAATTDMWNLFLGVPNGTYWEEVVVTAPNTITSNKATFTINC
jgi:serine/threonine protein kinase